MKGKIGIEECRGKRRFALLQGQALVPAQRDQEDLAQQGQEPSRKNAETQRKNIEYRIMNIE